MLDGTSLRPPMGSAFSSSELERYFPHTAPIIRRGSWTFGETGDSNSKVKSLGDSRRSDFNNVYRYRFEHREQAAELSEYALSRRLHRLRPNSTHGASRDEVAMEWERMEAEREEILAWGRATGMLREVVQQYRFERHTGRYSSTAHEAAAGLIEKLHRTIPEPINYAGVLIEWSEKEHRSWFWRCCRDGHSL